MRSATPSASAKLLSADGSVAFPDSPTAMRTLVSAALSIKAVTASHEVTQATAMSTSVAHSRCFSNRHVSSPVLNSCIGHSGHTLDTVPQDRTARGKRTLTGIGFPISSRAQLIVWVGDSPCYRRVVHVLSGGSISSFRDMCVFFCLDTVSFQGSSGITRCSGGPSSFVASRRDARLRRPVNCRRHRRLTLVRRRGRPSQGVKAAECVPNGARQLGAFGT